MACLEEQGSCGRLPRTRKLNLTQNIASDSPFRQIDGLSFGGLLVSTESYVPKASGLARMNRAVQHSASEGTDGRAKFVPAPKLRLVSQPSQVLFGKHLSPWSRSRAKRVFDCACVISMLPVLVPVFLLVGLAVRITSRGPVLFLQKRMGRHGREFTILKLDRKSVV